MHPILAYRGRLVPYLAAWVPLAGLLTAVVRTVGVGWAGAAVIAGPLALVYAFICLAAWYPCRSASPKSTSFAGIVVTQVVAAALSAMLWLFLADTWVVFLEQFPAFARAGARFPALVPIVLGAGVVLYALAAALHYLLMAFEEARRAERNALELEVLAKDAELRALRAQIDPHFLFNALNSISALTGSDAVAARKMCLELAELLRYSLHAGGAATIPLSEEFALVDRYLAIERARFGPRLSVQRQVSPPAGDCAVPPLLLQPLVENAVKHGVAQLIEGGAVRIGASCSGRSLHLTVENPTGPTPAAGRGEGVGLDNVRRRLAALYGPEATMEVRQRDGVFRVRLVLPAVPASSAKPVLEHTQ
jgi:two-component system, LytTR family, sensor histidine kinase AlgZ